MSRSSSSQQGSKQPCTFQMQCVTCQEVVQQRDTGTSELCSHAARCISKWYKENITGGKSNPHTSHGQTEDGEATISTSLSFDKAFPHHFNYALAVSTQGDALSTRDKEKMRIFVDGLCPGYSLPTAETIKNVLYATMLVQDANLRVIISEVKAVACGLPFISLQIDLWSRRLSKECFVALCCSMIRGVLADGTTADQPAASTRNLQRIVYAIELKLFQALMKFERFKRTKHTAQNIASWLNTTLNEFGLKATDIVLVTPDGESRQYEAVMKEAYGVTTRIEGEKYVTSHLVVPSFAMLRKHHQPPSCRCRSPLCPQTPLTHGASKTPRLPRSTRA